MEFEPGKTAVSVGDIMDQCTDAANRMSNLNPHKVLFLTCAYALKQLVDRINELETEAMEPKRVM